MNFLKKLRNRIESVFAYTEKRTSLLVESVSALALVIVAIILLPRLVQPKPPLEIMSPMRAELPMDIILSRTERIARVKILSEYPREEYANLPNVYDDSNTKAWADSRNSGNGGVLLRDTLDGTLFEAEITYDYLEQHKVSERILLFQSANPNHQFDGSPPYGIGDQYVMFLGLWGKTFWQPVGDVSSVFDIIKADGQEYLYKRSYPWKELDSYTLDMTEQEKARITTVKENPTEYFQKIKAEDLIAAVKQARRQNDIQDAN